MKDKELKHVNIAFGQYLKEIRSYRGLSQEELGFQCGLHRTYISLLERGLKSPTLESIFKICGTLKIPVDQFICGLLKNVSNKDNH